MSYPISSAVSAGDPTQASHYNNLRLDALYMGQAVTDAVKLGTLLERYESRLEIERLNTTQLRVVAAAAAPVSLMIGGCMVQAVANVDLDAGDAPSGAAADYYIFANRAASSTTFTLSVSTSSTESASTRRIGRFYWDGTAIVKDSIRTEFAIHITDLLYYVEPQICEGRLTLSTGVPVPVSDIGSSANVYFTPYKGNRIALYSAGYGWRLYTFSELTLDISAVADDKNLDIWMYDNAGAITLAYTEWSNDTLRATAIAYQDGVPCKSSALAYRYLGTVRTSAAGEVCDTKAFRYVWNCCNRRPRPLKKVDATQSWTYASTDPRIMNNDSNNKLQFVIGLDEDPVFVKHMVSVSGSSTPYNTIGLNLDASDDYHDDCIFGSAMNTSQQQHTATLEVFPGVGYHYIAMVENGRASNTSTFNGNDGMASTGYYRQHGATGWMMA